MSTVIRVRVMEYGLVHSTVKEAFYISSLGLFLVMEGGTGGRVLSVLPFNSCSICKTFEVSGLNPKQEKALIRYAAMARACTNAVSSALILEAFTCRDTSAPPLQTSNTEERVIDGTFMGLRRGMDD
jgi:hypothetical protein